MLPKSVFDKIQGNVGKPSFFKFLSPGENWKSKSMSYIPEEFVRSTKGAIDDRVVFSVRWGNSWLLWLERDKNGLFMIEEDWEMFVDDNHLGPKDILFFTHQDDTDIDVLIINKDLEEVMDAPLEAESESDPVNSNLLNSYQDTTNASASASELRDGRVPVKNPERYLKNPKNAYLVKTLTKKNDVLYVNKTLIQLYSLRFGPPNSAMTYLLPDGKEDAFVKLYSGNYAISGWASLCRRNNLKIGDSVVCELETASGGLVTAVRVHFVN